MNKDEVLKLAKSNGSYCGVGYVANGEVLFRADDLLAFANACEKIGMEKTRIHESLEKARRDAGFGPR